MLDFMITNQGEYIHTVGLDKAMEDGTDGAFKFLCSGLDKCEDKEVRIGFSRALMFMGFEKMMDITQEAMLSTMKNVPRRDFEEFPKDIQDTLIQRGVEVIG
jgi:hypothetical protein